MAVNQVNFENIEGISGDKNSYHGEPIKYYGVHISEVLESVGIGELLSRKDNIFGSQTVSSRITFGVEIEKGTCCICKKIVGEGIFHIDKYPVEELPITAQQQQAIDRIIEDGNKPKTFLTKFSSIVASVLH